MATIEGVARARQNIHERAAKVLGSRLSALYESHEFLVPDGAAATSIVTIVDHGVGCSCVRGAGPFALVARAAQVSVRNLGTGRIAIRFNAAGSDPIPVLGGEYLYWTFVETTGIYLSNASGAARLVAIAWA